MWAIERFDTLAHSGIPLMNYRIPAPGHQSVLINELNAKNSVTVAAVVPLSSFKNCADAFRVYFYVFKILSS